MITLFIIVVLICDIVNNDYIEIYINYPAYILHDPDGLRRRLHMQQKILLKNSNVEHYRGYDIFQAKNGYFFAISNNPDYLDVDGCESAQECKDDIDSNIDGLFEEVE